MSRFLRWTQASGFALVESGTCEVGLTDAADVPVTLAAVDLGTQELMFVLLPGSAPGGRDPLAALERGEFHSSWRRAAHRLVDWWTNSSLRSVINPHLL